MTTENYRPPVPLTVIGVNGKQFVCGLTWKILEHNRTYMKEARVFGKANDMDMVAIRRGRALQGGFAPKSEQRLRGMYSLAAALAGKLGDNWVGVFALSGERYAFVAVHEGSVMIGRDLVGDFATVEFEFNETLNLLMSDTRSTWGENGKGIVVGPADWPFTNDHRTLEELLQPKQLRNDYRLRPLTLGLTGREMALGGASVIVITALVLGYFKWQAIQDQKRSEDAAAAMVQLRNAQQEQESAAAEARKNSLLRPWEHLPTLEAFTTACQAFWEQTPVSLGGWIFAGGQCGPGKALATYKRPNGGTTVGDFAAEVRRRYNLQPDIFEAGTSATIAASLKAEGAGAGPLPAAAKQLEDFTARLQAVGGGTTFSLEAKPWSAPEGQPEAVPPDWTTQGFNIKTDKSPADLLAGLDAQGVRVLEIAASFDQASARIEWSITGELYGR